MSDAVKNANRVVLNVTDEGSPSRLEMLTHQAGTRLLKTASQKPEWETAYLAAVLAVGTTARGCELRGLRWADVNLIDRAVTLASEDKWEIAPAARLDACRIKTSESYRVVPLTRETFDALLKLRKRAEIVWAGRTITLRVRGFPDEFRFRNRAGMRGGTVEGMQVDGMVKRYSHIQFEVKRAAIQALSSCPKITTSEGVNVTKHVTKQAEGKLADGSG